MNATELEAKARWVWRETLKLHALCQETRIASSLSCAEILVALHYGGVLRFDPKQPLWEGRDRFVISKGHGSISFYPILADLGFFDPAELQRPGLPGALLKAIPDPHIPGYETVNGSLGHGIGVAAGMALGLRAKKSGSAVFVLAGDGELYEGAMWEGVMLAGHQRLANLCVIVDNNRQCMLDYCRNVLDLSPLGAKFEAFGWEALEVDGHDFAALLPALESAKRPGREKPLVIIANTIKGRGVPTLEGQPLCHIFNVKADDVAKLVREESR